MSIRNTLTGLFIVLSFLSRASCTFVPTVTTTPAICYGDCNGTATVMISGTTGPYVITGIGGPMTTTGTPVTLTGLCAGTYTLLVTDAGSCSTPVVFTITQPPQLTISATPTPGPGCTGSISVTPSGGTGGPYIYSIDGGTYGVSASFTGLCPGSHTVCVKDGNGCIACTTVTLTSSCSMVSTVGGYVFPACYGDCNGSAVVASTLGTAPYTATLSTGAVYTYTGSTNMTGLCAGVYTLGIVDAVGCTNTYVFTIGQPPQLVVSATTTPGTGCTGSITASSTGGTGAVVYSIDGGTYTSSATFTGLCPGPHNVCAQDANGCVSCITVTLTASCSMVSTAYPTSNISCYGSCDGVVTLASTGGTPPYSVIDPTTGATVTYTSGTTFSGMCAGTYTFYITDATGCTNTQVVTLTQPSQIIVSASVTNESTPGACDGSIDATASGGTPAYVYSIDGGLTWTGSHVFTGLCAGTYTVCAEDINGCESCTTYVVSAGGCTLTSPFINTFSPACHGGCDGFVVIGISGGTPIYTTTVGSSSYTSSGPVTVPGLCAGPHTAVIADAGGCAITVTFVITDPAPMVTTISVGSNPSSASACDGVINGAVSGGTASYTYTWVSCPSMSPTGITSAPPASGFCAGSYAFIVTDANGCTDTSACVTLSVPTGLTEVNSETIALYPNPTTGVLNIRTGTTEPLRLVLTDLLGKRLADLPLNGETSIDLHVQGLDTGIYFVLVTNGEKIIHTQKIVLTR